MNEMELKERTKRIALRAIKVVEALPSTKVADVIGRQLLRSGTSVGANYRAACRGKSPADMIAKLAIVEEEADESIYWIELLIESEILPVHRLVELIDELNQIVAITVSSQKSLRRNNPKSKMTSFSRPPPQQARADVQAGGERGEGLAQGGVHGGGEREIEEGAQELVLDLPEVGLDAQKSTSVEQKSDPGGDRGQVGFGFDSIEGALHGFGNDLLEDGGLGQIAPGLAALVKVLDAGESGLFAAFQAGDLLFQVMIDVR